MTPPSGLLLVTKPIGPTSHDVVGRARYVLGTKKVGHAGTLDPMASGLLILGIERGTKLLGHLALKDKSYLATIRLGQSTTTEDAEGEFTASVDASAVTRDQVLAGMAALTGDIQQVPSSVSAIKVDGVRSYDRVRSGEEVVLAARPVTITAFELLDQRAGEQIVDLDVRVDCTTGTYIRALARDLGAALGVGAHLTALRRTRIGPFSIEDAVDIYAPDGPPVRPGHAEPSVPRAQRPPRPPRPAIDPELREEMYRRIQPAAEVAREAFEVRDLTPAESAEVGYGRPIPPRGVTGTYALMEADRLVALAVDTQNRAKPVLVWGDH
ncbi:tRNA pseudouridine(55) synthase TruB [Nakamurella silvestris]|nr:tRNA pseudouridine(55) synthase TruB [Nakamurella silvestris]